MTAANFQPVMPGMINEHLEVSLMQPEKPYLLQQPMGPVNGSSFEPEAASDFEASLTNQHNLGVEDILAQLRGVTMRDPLFFDEQEMEHDLMSGPGKKLVDMQQQMVNELSQENFDSILANLER